MKDEQLKHLESVVERISSIIIDGKEYLQKDSIEQGYFGSPHYAYSQIECNLKSLKETLEDISYLKELEAELEELENIMATIKNEIERKREIQKVLKNTNEDN